MNKDPNRLNVALKPENKVALEKIRARQGLRSLNAAVNWLIENARAT